MTFLAGLLLGFLVGCGLTGHAHRRRLRSGRIDIAGETYRAERITDEAPQRIYIN